MATQSGDRYKTGNGYVTEHSRRMFIEDNPSVEAPTSLVAGKNGEPLFFWQLHSILGSQRIEAIIRRFYTLVWEGEDWFKEAFVLTNDLEGHIWTQSAFWIDAMGGGRAYHGACAVRHLKCLWCLLLLSSLDGHILSSRRPSGEFRGAFQTLVPPLEDRGGNDKKGCHQMAGAHAASRRGV